MTAKIQQIVHHHTHKSVQKINTRGNIHNVCLLKYKLFLLLWANLFDSCSFLAVESFPVEIVANFQNNFQETAYSHIIIEIFYSFLALESPNQRPQQASTQCIRCTTLPTSF